MKANVVQLERRRVLPVRAGALYRNSAQPQQLAERSVCKGLVTMVASWGLFAVLSATTVYLARTLGPKEFGAAAVIVVVAGLTEPRLAPGVHSGSEPVWGFVFNDSLAQFAARQ
jgi:hypothetical protein